MDYLKELDGVIVARDEMGGEWNVLRADHTDQSDNNYCYAYCQPQPFLPWLPCRKKKRNPRQGHHDEQLCAKRDNSRHQPGGGPEWGGALRGRRDLEQAKYN